MQASALSKARWAFALSLVVVVAAVAAGYAVNMGRYATYEIRSREPVSGLIPGAPVEFHGVEVGEVREVQLTDPRNVRVLLAVRKDAPVSTATVATITGRGLATRGFTGYVIVNLEDRGGPAAPLAATKGSAHPVIASAPPQTVSLDTTISELSENVQRVTATLEGMLDRNTVASMKQSLANLEQVTRTLAANNQRIESFLTNAERASTQLEPLLQSGNDTVRALQLQLLPEAQRTLARMEHLSTTLDETASRIQRNPSVLWRGARPVPAGPGEAQ